MTASLEGKVIIVTGAAGGIGSATARVLGNAGAKVVLSDITEDASEIASEMCALNQEASFIQADIGEEEQVAELVARTVSQYGRLDGAFNNAGLEQCVLPLAELSTAQWERAIQIDLTAVFFCLKYQINAMLEYGTGAIVNTASALGQVALKNASEYVAAKHGVIGLTKSAAADYGSRGIRVNAVLPGIIETPMVARVSKDPQFSVHFDQLRARHPVGRFGEPIEVATAVRWLLSKEASFVNGASISVDGGYLAV